MLSNFIFSNFFGLLFFFFIVGFPSLFILFFKLIKGDVNLLKMRLLDVVNN